MTLMIEIGNKTIDFSALPELSQRAMAGRGFRHYFGNEQAAKVGPNSSWFTKFVKENGRNPTEDEVKARNQLNFDNALKALNEGTVGQGRGPKLDPVEAEMDRAAEREVWDTLAGANLCKANKKPKDDDSFTFADGSTFTFEELIDRKLEKHGPRLKAAAEKKVEAEKAKREATKAKAAKVAEQGAPANADALGL